MSSGSLSQVVLWVGLGILVISTHSTLFASDYTAMDTALGAHGGQRAELEAVVKAEAALLPGMPWQGRGRDRGLQTLWLQ